MSKIDSISANRNAPLVVAVVTLVLVAVVSAALHVIAQSVTAQRPQHTYARWEHGLPKKAGYFPIAVWLQQPRNAKRFQELGFNLYVGLWQGPTSAQLAELKAADMPVICAQNAVGLTDKNRDMIVGWMHDDEPDNAQSLGNGKGYGPPIEPKKVVADHRRMSQTDPSRPILLNLGQGVAWDRWYGRGVRTNHPEDYPEYLEGCDIVSFDISPPCMTNQRWPASWSSSRVAWTAWSSGAKVGPTLAGAVSVRSSDAGVPIDILVKADEEATYVFAVAMRNRPTIATVTCKQTTAMKAEVLGENRTLELHAGVFSDDFAPYAVHIYRLK